MRIAVYARYSSDMQNAASIGDQVALCTRRAAELGGGVAQIFSDAAMSGSHAAGRPGLQALLDGARAGRFDAVLAEALDRISRDQEDVAGIHKRLAFAGVKLFTVEEGEIGPLHIGLKGTMNALFLEQLAAKVRRGLAGRAHAGRSAGGLAYGYRVVRKLGEDGEPVRGLREPHPEQAPVVRRIFEAYARGDSAKKIAHDLNRDGVPSPAGRAWGVSTIAGNRARASGILWNEAYCGYIVWNRVRMVKDPETGKRLSRPNPPAEWVVTAAPELALVDRELWDAVQARKAQFAARPLQQRTRPKRLLSGLVHCACCGGAYVVVDRVRMGCAVRRNSGTCDNARTILAEEMESRVLAGLKDELLHPDIVAEYLRAWREGAAERRKAAALRARTAKSELADVERRIRRLADAIEAGSGGRELAGRLQGLEARREALEAHLAAEAREEPVVALHPGAADRYRRQVERLEAALTDDSLRGEARDILASLVRVEIGPGEGRGRAAVEIVANLNTALALAQPSRPTMMELVAGDRYGLDQGSRVRLAV